MGEIASTDDSVDRFVVLHYRFDAVRRERRNVVLAAYDTSEEMERHILRDSATLRELVTRGEAEPREHVFGIVKRAGYDAEVRSRREADWSSRAHWSIRPPHLEPSVAQQPTVAQ